MANQITRKNHYVPEWYQQGFLEPGQSRFHYLDTAPAQKAWPDGRIVTMNAVHEWGPRNCFYEYDLYSTRFGSLVNDEVEKYLFGPIDDRGAKAVRAFAVGDPSAMHSSFEDFFEHLDAQKLRTPKGLDWIKSRYRALDQLQLMREMQGLRFMHCTMWTEGVREIVSAEDSDVKFIVTDHPVTAYTAALPPSSPECAYPEDPPLEAKGTQTVFALDANNCLILTHLEYAEDPKATDLTSPRTHARYRGQSLVRTDAFIRKRKLLRDEVITINYLLKTRARRYVAASDRERLSPESSFRGAWKDIAQVLLPKDDLWRFGGEIYVGHTDGSSQYQDAFGRTSDAHKYLQRTNQVRNLGPNDMCGCGSGRKFKQCCKDVPEANRPSWKVYGIRERNLMLCHAVQDILGLSAGKTWEDVRRELNDEQVKRIHMAFGSLWPEDTDLAELLPRPTNRAFRALYLGVSDPRTVEATALGWLPYFDEVVLAHPFINHRRVKPEFSPTETPSQHKAQTLKNVLLLLILEPFIRSGFVHLIPDPGDFNPQFGRSALQMAEERTAGWKADRRSMSRLEAIMKDDHGRLLRQLPKDSLRRSFRDRMPEASEEEIESTIAYMKEELAGDPYALLQRVEPGEAGAQFLYFKGYGLEAAMYLATLTGSCIYTDADAYWQQLHLHALQTDQAEPNAWTPVVSSLGAIDFPIDLSAQTLFEVRVAGRLGGVRTAMRRLANAVQSTDRPQADQVAAQLTRATQAIKNEWAGVSETLRLTGRLELSIPAGGFERNDVRRLLLTFGKAKSVHPISFAMLIKLEGSGAAV